jgi:rRNA maturation endonuclease Nob1
MFCIKCGKQIPDDSKFCPECGAIISDEAPEVEKPKTEEPKTEEPKVEAPKAEEPEVEAPKAEEPKVEAPKAEEPKVEAPKAEEPKVEAPKAEEPKVEAPKVEAPKVEAPKVEAPNVEVPRAASGVKYCVACGSKMNATSRFCPKCGADNGVRNQSGQQGNAYQQGYAQQRNTQTSQMNNQMKAFTTKYKKNSEFKKTVAILGGAVAAILILIIILRVAIKPTINLNKYTEVTFDGYDSVGTASVTFDRDKFEEDYDSKLTKKLKKNAKKMDDSDRLGYMVAASLESASDTFLDSCVNTSLDKSTGLSNGDKVKMTWNCEDEDAEKYFGYKLKYKDEEVKVDGLEKVKTFDPFAGLEVVFTGTAPNGLAQINTPASIPEAECLQYSLDKNQGLKNGDKVTVKISAYSGDVSTACIEQYGDIPSATTKEFTVDGLGSYITKAAEIPDATLKEMQGQAVDAYKSYAVNSYNDSESLDSISYLGTYLLTAKAAQNMYDGLNKLYLVYKITTKINQEGGWFTEAYQGSADSYWYVEYSDLILASDKNIDYDVTNYNTPSSNQITAGDGAWNGYFPGYPTLNALKTDVVTGNAENYKCEENVNADAAKSSVASESTESQSVEEDSANGDSTIAEVFPDSSDKLLSDSDIENLSKDDLRFAINEPYARHGYIFKDQGLQDHFDQFDWYDGTESDDKTVYKEFNDIEKKNIELMQKKRDELK